MSKQKDTESGLQSTKERLRKKLDGRFNFLKIGVMFSFCNLKKADKRLLQYKDAYEGDRCFIVATGPSLTLEDVEKLKYEKTFSMNSCIKFFDKTSWRPSFYMLMDPEVYTALYDKVNDADLPTVFYNAFSILSIAREGIPVKINSWYMTYLKTKRSKMHPKQIGFSKDALKYLYDAHTTVYIAMQMAAFMGFKEIYLLGNDCDYTGAQHSGIASYQLDSPTDAGEKIMADYRMAKEQIEKLGIRVYNATRGGKLEVFERVDFDSIDFKTKENEKDS